MAVHDRQGLLRSVSLVACLWLGASISVLGQTVKFDIYPDDAKVYGVGVTPKPKDGGGTNSIYDFKVPLEIQRVKGSVPRPVLARRTSGFSSGGRKVAQSPDRPCSDMTTVTPTDVLPS